jgi:ubiquinone/menaquinone biosynthesis C-methylase UbiE
MATDMDSAATDAAGALLVGAMWWYSAAVLQPARASRLQGAPPDLLREPGLAPPRPGLGPRFSAEQSGPLLLGRSTEHDHLVTEFDRMSEAYDAYVRPFSVPIFEEALRALRPLLSADMRILDAGCGPGREVRRVAACVPDGEVVGVDLAAGMVMSAYLAARAAGLDNTAFVQADVGDLPRAFDGQFDLVYNCLAHHHYPEPRAAATSVRRSLRPGGIYAIIDPGPAWYIALSSSLARLADPGWVRFHSPNQFQDLLTRAGFACVSWHQLLPGFGLCIGKRPA